MNIWGGKVNQIISSVCDLSIFYWFNKKYKVKNHEKLRKVISFIIIFGVVKVEDYFHVSNLLLLTCINFVMYVVIFFLSYGQKAKTIVFRNMEILAGVMIGEIFVILVTMLLTMRYDFDLILDATNVRWGVIYTASKICECSILNIVNKISDNMDKKKIGKIVIWNIIFLGGVLTCLYIYLNNIIAYAGQLEVEKVFFIQLVILGGVLLAYLNIMNRYYHMNQEKIELENFFNEVKREASYYEQTNALHEEVRKIKHDLKNFLILSSNNVGKEYLKDVDEYFDKFNNYINSGNRILDLLLMNKSKVCKEKGINFKYDLTVQNLSGLNALDIISVFGNVIDNAIEACEKNSVKEIRLKTWEANGCIFIEVINPVNEIIVKHSKFMTTKKNKEHHGLGLTCLNEALKRYGGTCKIYVEEKLFNVIICIPLKNMSN